VVGEKMPHLGVLICIGLAALLYLFFSYALGLVRQEDLGNLGEKLPKKRREKQP
jgi:hypothetical protein